MPMHTRRRWVVGPAESAQWLAERLVNHSWCSCAGWSLGGLLFLNDQTSPDGAFEVAVVKPPLDNAGGPWWQIESITFGWLSSPMVLAQHLRETGEHATPEQLARTHINQCLSGAIDPGRPGSVAWLIPRLDVETPQQHGRCQHCA